MRSDVRFWEGRRDAPAARPRRGSVHLARYLISTTTRGDAATRGERRCYAPWTVIVPDNMTPSGGPRSSEGEMRDEPGARVRLRRPRGSRPAVGRVGARRVEIFFLVGRIEPFVHELISPHHMVHSPAARPFV